MGGLEGRHERRGEEQALRRASTIFRNAAPLIPVDVWWFVLGCWWLVSVGCSSHSENEIVVYTALDEDFSRPVFAQFEQTSGIRVRTKFDTESTKSVGLTQTILAERARPRCDLFWNNEILNTLRLERAGLLRVYRSPIAKDYPDLARSPDGTWHGFAARARVLIVNRNLVPAEARPISIRDLTDPKWENRCGQAKPLFGTTATHATVLFASWGDDEAIKFYRAVKENAQILAGNKRVALAVSAGQIAWGVTDTDDAIIELERGAPVTIVYPDQDENGLGTLFIPNTLALIKGSPSPKAAERLVDYLLSPEIETALAKGRSAQIPLNPAVDVALRTESPQTVRPMLVDWAAALQKWDASRAFLTDEFASAD